MNAKDWLFRLYVPVSVGLIAWLGYQAYDANRQFVRVSDFQEEILDELRKLNDGLRPGESEDATPALPQAVTPDPDRFDNATQRDMASVMVEHDPALMEYVHSHPMPMPQGVSSDDSIKVDRAIWETKQLFKSIPLQDAVLAVMIVLVISLFVKRQWNPRYAEERANEIQKIRREARFRPASTLLLLFCMAFLAYMWVIEFPAMPTIGQRE